MGEGSGAESPRGGGGYGYFSSLVGWGDVQILADGNMILVWVCMIYDKHKQ